jgi:hypothetical protein
MWGRLTAAFVGLLVAACSDDGGKSSNDSPAGGQAGSASGGAAGSSGSSGSGGSGGTRLTTGVRGAVSVHITDPGTCPIRERYEDFPQLAAGRPVTDADHGGALADGDVTAEGEVVSISCTWSGTSPPYNIYPQMTVGTGLKSKRMTFNVALALEEPVATKTFVVNAPDMLNPYSGDCTLIAHQLDQSNHSVWGEVSCDPFEDAALSNPKPCSLATSYFYFENCKPQ